MRRGIAKILTIRPRATRAMSCLGVKIIYNSPHPSKITLQTRNNTPHIYIDN
jgi:hypothetical protein